MESKLGGGSFVGGFFFPHGAIILDAETRDFANVPAVTRGSKENCIRLHASTLEQAKLVISQNPDLIIISTPHGLNLRDTFLFFGNSKAVGSSVWDGEWAEFTATANIDTIATELLVDKLQAIHHAVEVVTMGVIAETELPLAWAEVIPLWFLDKAAKELGATLPPIVLVGQLRLGSTKALDGRLKAMTAFGGDLISIVTCHDYFRQKRVAVVVSGDLAHSHSKCKTARFPFHESGLPFDNHILEYAKTSINLETLETSSELLLNKAGTLEFNARTCGYSGLVMLHGMMLRLLENGEVKEFKASLIDYSAPTYYGMLVNNFMPSN